jgi:precorrin-6B methylase 2
MSSSTSGDWENMRSGFFPPAVREAALAAAGIVPGLAAGRVCADVGAGSGFVSEALLAAGAGVFAIDREPGMLEQLRARLGGGAAARLATLEGSGDALPLPDMSVDAVFANMYLHHADDPALAIREMARILKPGGRLVITDLDSHGHEFLLREQHDRWPGFARTDVSAWLAAAGLQKASVGSCGAGGQTCCADSCDGSDSARVSIFLASAVRPLWTATLDEAAALAAGARARAGMAGDRPLLCAESTFKAVAEALGMASPLVPRAATGFCSGLSRSCGACGVFSAGVLALGVALGRDCELDDLDRTYLPVQDYREFFLSRFGSLDCRGLTGCDLGDAAGLADYRARGLKHSVCAGLLEQGAAQLVRIIAANS